MCLSLKFASGIKSRTPRKKTIYVGEEPKEEAVAQSKEVVSENPESSEEENYQNAAKPIEVKQAKNEAVPKYKYYTVQKGDTLFKIASAKGVSVDQIKHLNRGLKENKLAVGQKSKIKQI